jgi:hypothetical protein
LKTAIEAFAVVYGVSCLYVVTQAVREKLSRTEIVIFAVASLVIPAYFFLGKG